MPQIPYVRVKDKQTKHEFSVVAPANESIYTVLDKPATRADGTPLPPKHYVAPPEFLPSKGQQATDTSKEK